MKRITLLGALLWATIANAQTTAPPSEIETLRAQIAALQQRLDQIEAEQKQAAKKPIAAPVTAKNPVTLSGTLQVHATTFWNQSANPVADTFRLRRGELRLTGQIAPRIVGTVQIDPAKQLTINAAGAVNQNSSILQEIAVQYLMQKTPRGAHYFDIGQFKIPIGYEGDQTTLANLQTIERALMYTQRDPFQGGYGDIRDSGARLRGTLGAWCYDLGVFNGFGERQNALAQSDAKAVMGRLIYSPQRVPGLRLGISGAKGDTGSPTTDRELWNGFAAYKHGKITAQAEYLHGNEMGTLNGALTQRNIQSYYGSIGYLLRPKIEGVVRYDYFDTNRALVGANGSDITLGVNYYLKGTNAKIQANLVRRSGDPAAHTTSGLGDLRNNRYELRTNFQIGF
jgi:phosphate-selective porin